MYALVQYDWQFQNISKFYSMFKFIQECRLFVSMLILLLKIIIDFNIPLVVK